MSHQLNIRVVAEGVEEASQKQILHDLGCDYMQGFLIGKPAALQRLIEHKSSVLPATVMHD